MNEEMTFDALESFIKQFTAKNFLDTNNCWIRDDKIFLVSAGLFSTIQKLKPLQLYAAGLFLGKSRGSQFFPSVNLLGLIVPHAHSIVIVNEGASFLFVCGRDILSQGIISAKGHQEKGGLVLVLNEHHDCLGFGKLLKKIGQPGAIVKNIFDIGDFLRREVKKRVFNR